MRACRPALSRRRLAWRRLGEEIIDARFGRDCRSGQRVVTRDHHGANTPEAHLSEALPHAAFDDVFEMDDTEGPVVIGYHQWSAAGPRDTVRDVGDPLRKHAAQFDYMLANPPFGVEWKQQQRAIEQERDSLGFQGRFGAGKEGRRRDKQYDGDE